MTKSGMNNVPLTGTENDVFLQTVWENEHMQSFADFSKKYNQEIVVPTLEPMQKMIEFYHNKGVDVIKHGCTLHNLANINLHNSTVSKFYPFTETDKDLFEKIREDMDHAPTIVFARKAVVDKISLGNQRICANLLWVLMPVRFIPTQCVSQFLLV